MHRAARHRCTRRPAAGPAAAALVLLLGAALALAGCDLPAPERTPRHVLLITVDTLRADHLAAYGYPRPTSPAVDALAERGVLFERAVCQWPKTGTSFASMFTGQYPQTTGLTHEAAIRIPDEYLTLPELFAEEGFTTVATVSNAVLSRELGWHRGFDEYLETWTSVPELPADPVAFRALIDAGRVNELALPLLARHRDAERLFAWIHYSDPHVPYLLPQGVDNPFLGDAHFSGDAKAEFGDTEAARLAGRDDLAYYVAQYDANVLFVERKVEELLAAADELGLLDDTLVVYTADHGESLGEHGYFFGHGRLPYSPGAHVPLVISYPGGGVATGRRVADPVGLVDLYPTLLELALPGRRVPGLEGHSLGGFLSGRADELERARERFVYAFAEAGGGSPTTHFRTVEDERWKLVYHPALRQRPRLYELYDLESDPLETVDLAAAEPRQLRRLRGELSGWMKGEWIRLPKSEVDAHSEETLRALRALGYIQ